MQICNYYFEGSLIKKKEEMVLNETAKINNGYEKNKSELF